MIHVLLFFVLILSLIGSITKNRKWNHFLFFISFLILFFVAAFRFNYGNDYVGYSNAFDAIKNGSIHFGDEILFFLLCKYSLDFQIMIAFLSLIYLLVIGKLIKDNVSNNKYFCSLFIFLINPYLYLMSLSAIRQTIACCFFIIAIHLAYKKKIVPYVMLIILASLYHKSAIILLPMYFLCNNKKISKRTFFIIFFLTLVFLFIPDKLNYFINLFLCFFDDPNYYYYFSVGDANSLRSVLLTCVPLVYLLLNINYLGERNIMYSKLYFVSLILGVLAFRLGMLTRFQMYFDIFSVIVIPSIICFTKSKEYNNKLFAIFNKYFLPSCVLLIFVLKYYAFFTNDLWSRFFYYRTIFG